MFSQKMPEHWVMGGVVSLEFIKVHPTPFDGSAESGPTQVTSEIAEDKVIDPNVPMDSSYGYPTPSFVEGLIIQTDSKSKMCFKTGVTTRPASRMVAWLRGNTMGSVTSHGFTHPTMERSPFKLIGWRPISGVPAPGGHFPTETPRRFGGESCFPASHRQRTDLWQCGNALITLDLPKAFQETDTTGGAGQTLGVLLVLTTDFQHLDIAE